MDNLVSEVCQPLVKLEGIPLPVSFVELTYKEFQYHDHCMVCC